MKTRNLEVPGYFCLLFTGLFFMISCDMQEQQLSHDMDISDSSVEVSWQMNSNFEPDNKFSATLTLTNNGTETFPADGWTLYLNSIRALDADSFLPEMVVSHINGDFFKIEPTDEFSEIGPGESRVIDYNANFHAIKKSDAPQGFYFVFEDGSVEQINEVIVGDFTEPEQMHRNPNDNVEVPTPGSIFEKNENLTLLAHDEMIPIIPTPVSAERLEGEFLLSEGVTISYDEVFENEVNVLTRVFESEGIDNQTGGENSSIELSLNDEIAEEGYHLNVNPEKIEISASGPAGMFYGVQSLKALIENRPEGDNISSYSVEDYSQFSYRGMHLDVSRNFHDVDDVKRLLDIMGMYKLNKFHFHLTDDEGWRLAIDQLPELVEVGGRRGHTEDESNYLIPAYGSGPDPTPGNSFGSGWYSRDEYIDLLKFATERHIEVIPEIDVPGHARAAIIAMQARADRLSEAGDEQEANRYRLDEEGDQSEYRSIQSFDDNVINVCQESTYNFLGLVFDEVISMHADADAPLTSIHIGGDEVPAGVWEDSPACETYMAEHDLEDTRELQVHFFGQMRDMLEERGLKMAGWEEIAFRGEPHGEAKTPNPEFAGSVIPHIWSNIWGSGTEDYAYVLANMGYEIVMSHASNFYFDMAYNKHPEEPGFYWASLFDTKEPFSFIPFNLYENAVTDSYGNPIPEGHFDGEEQLTEEGRANILGLQGQLWTETVNREGRMDYMIFPRLLGLAERAWAGNPDWSDHVNREQLWSARDEAWNNFANRLGQYEFTRLDKNHPGINYRIPPPGAVIDGDMLHANSDFPGLTIRYTTDGSDPSESSTLYEGPVQISGNDTIKISAFNEEGRSSRVVLINSDIE